MQFIFLYFLLTVVHSHTILNIINPHNGTKIGTTVFLSVKINDNGLKYINSSFILKISSNNLVIYEQPQTSLIFECILGDVFHTGWNKIAASLSTQQNDVESFDIILIYSIPTHSDVLSEIIKFSAAEKDKNLFYSYFLGGFDNRYIARFSALDAERLVIFGSDNSSCNVIGSSRISKCIQPFHNTLPHFMANISMHISSVVVVVDFVFLSLNGLLRSCGYNVEVVTDILRRIDVIARKRLWVFSAENTSIFYDSVLSNMSILKMTHCRQLCQSHVDFEEGVPSVLLRDAYPESFNTTNKSSHCIYIWVCEFQPLSNNLEEFSTASALEERIPQHRPHKYRYSSAIHIDLTYGRPRMVLADVCYHFISRSLILRRDPGAAQPIIDASLLLTEESRGFLYVGPEVVELEGDGAEARATDDWPLLSGCSALALSVQPSHIVHDIEPWIQLLHPSPNCRMSRLFLPTMGPAKVKDWTLSFLGAVLAWMELHYNASSPAVFLKLHTEPHQGLCFHRLLVLGRANPHTRFFGSMELAKRFREFIFEREFISSPRRGYHWALYNTPFAGPGAWSENSFDPYCRGHSPACSLQLYPAADALTHRRLRVTIALRPGVQGQRLILNLNNLVSLMSRSGLVDTHWLHTHMLFFELMTFAEQLQVMVETDLFVSVHGATIMNGMFMLQGSAVIDIFNGPFAEFVFAVPLRECGVMLFHLHQWDTAKFAYCPTLTESESRCWNYSRTRANIIDCWSLRQCAVTVDEVAFEATFMEAYSHILTAKWLMEV